MGIRWVEVDPARMPRWVAGFGERHGGYTVRAGASAAPQDSGDGAALALVGGDGAVAECHVAPGVPAPTGVDGLAADPARRFGLLLARRGGYAVGVVDGVRLVSSKVDSRYVQSRTAAGGWSQQRFARRRDNQAKAAAGEAVEACLRLLVPVADSLVALVTGGDRRFVSGMLEDPRLAPLQTVLASRFLDVPDPKKAVLEAAVTAARAVRIRLQD